MKKTYKKILPYIIVAGSFLLTYLISRLFLSEVYLFEWSTRNSYWYIWLVALLLVMFGQKIVAYAISLGNIVGLVAGHFLDEFIRPIRMAKITPDMSTEQIYILSNHKAAFYWIETVLIFMVIGIVITCVKRKK